MSLKLSKFLFRYRAFPYLVLLPVLLFDNHWLLKDPYLTFILGPAIVLTGIAIRLWCIRHIGGAARVKDKATSKKKLITSGPFAFCRNPIYIANTIMVAGAAVMMRLLWMTPIIFVGLLIWYHLIVKYEESILAGNYGDEYQQYASRTPRWIPSLTARRLNQPSETPALFPWRKLMKYERGGVANIIIVVTLTLVKEFVLKY